MYRLRGSAAGQASDAILGSLPGHIVVAVVVVLLVVDEVVPVRCAFISLSSSGPQSPQGPQSRPQAAACRVGNALLQQLLLVKLEFARHSGVPVESNIFLAGDTDRVPVGLLL
jgi:hypothetical protein